MFTFVSSTFDPYRRKWTMKEVRQINELRRAFNQASMIAEGEEDNDGGGDDDDSKKQSTATIDSASSSSSSSVADFVADSKFNVQNASPQELTSGNNDPNTSSHSKQAENKTTQSFADKNGSTGSPPSNNVQLKPIGDPNSNDGSKFKPSLSGHQQQPMQKPPPVTQLKKADLDQIAEDHFPPELRSYDGVRTCMGWTYYEFLESLNTSHWERFLNRPCSDPSLRQSAERIINIICVAQSNGTLRVNHGAACHTWFQVHREHQAPLSLFLHYVKNWCVDVLAQLDPLKEGQSSLTKIRREIHFLNAVRHPQVWNKAVWFVTYRGMQMAAHRALHDVLIAITVELNMASQLIERVIALRRSQEKLTELHEDLKHVMNEEMRALAAIFTLEEDLMDTNPPIMNPAVLSAKRSALAPDLDPNNVVVLCLLGLWQEEQLVQDAFNASHASVRTDVAGFKVKIRNCVAKSLFYNTDGKPLKHVQNYAPSALPDLCMEGLNALEARRRIESVECTASNIESSFRINFGADGCIDVINALIDVLACFQPLVAAISVVSIFIETAKLGGDLAILSKLRKETGMLVDFCTDTLKHFAEMESKLLIRASVALKKQELQLRDNLPGKSKGELSPLTVMRNFDYAQQEFFPRVRKMRDKAIIAAAELKFDVNGNTALTDAALVKEYDELSQRCMGFANILFLREPAVAMPELQQQPRVPKKPTPPRPQKVLPRKEEQETAFQQVTEKASVLMSARKFEEAAQVWTSGAFRPDKFDDSYRGQALFQRATCYEGSKFWHSAAGDYDRAAHMLFKSGEFQKGLNASCRGMEVYKMLRRDDDVDSRIKALEKLTIKLKTAIKDSSKTKETMKEPPINPAQEEEEAKEKENPSGSTDVTSLAMGTTDNVLEKDKVYEDLQNPTTISTPDATSPTLPPQSAATTTTTTNAVSTTTTSSATANTTNSAISEKDEAEFEKIVNQVKKLMEHGLFAKALEPLMSDLIKQKKFPEAYRAKGRVLGAGCFRELGQFDEAAREYEAAGRALAKANMKDEAIESANNALDVYSAHLPKIERNTARVDAINELLKKLNSQ